MTAWIPKWNFTLTQTIVLGFGAVLVLLVLQSVFSNLGLRDLVQGVTQTQTTHQQSLNIYLFETQVADLQRNVLAYNLSGYRGLIQRVELSHKQIAQALQSLQQGVQDEKRRFILQRMDAHLASYGKNFQAAVVNREDREILLQQELLPQFSKLRRLLAQWTQATRLQGRNQLAFQLDQETQSLTQAHQMVLDFTQQPDIAIHQGEETLLLLGPRLQSLARGGLPQAQLALQGQALRELVAYRRFFLAMVQSTRNYLQLHYVVMAGEAAEIGFLAKELEAETKRLQEEIDHNQQRQFTNLERIILLMTLGALGLGGWIAWWLTGKTTTPIKEMTRALTSLARGQQEAEIPGQGRGDEIGAMAMAAHVFKEKALELEHASRYKSEFLANMSHELRTPLNSLLILSRLLTENPQGNLTPDQVESAKVIYESGSDLLRLINDVLDLSKVEAGRMEVVIKRDRWKGLLTRLERQFKPLALAKGLQLSWRVLPQVPLDLETDWTKLEQILRNLLSNAFKFTQTGSVTLEVHLPRRNCPFINQDLTPDNALAVTVQDTGIGIPDNKQQQIFEAFRQVDGTTSRKYGGTGLGLSITRRFSELLGGEVQVESSLGQGSSFTLFLPLEFPPWLPHQRPVINQRDQGQREHVFFAPHKTILVVDDDPRNHYALGQALKGRVKEVLKAEHGQAALEVLTSGKQVDLILMDVMMPIMSGTEATLAIRKLEAFRSLPIIALTAKVMAGDRERCLAAGANDYLAKPVDPEVLFACLARWLKNSTVPAASNPPEPVAAPAQALPPQAGLTRLAQARILIVDDDAKSNFSLAQGLQPFCAAVTMAPDGEKCLQLLRSHPVQLVVMDLLMPRQDGVETIRQLRNQPAWARLPMIAVSAEASSGHAQAALAAGANAFLPKPLDPAALAQVMERLLESHE